MMIVFLDTEFTDLIEPELLSLGAVSLDGHEHYVELDMSTEIGQARLKASSDFVRCDGVLDMFGLVPGASATYEEMGRRTAEWLLQLAAESGTRVEVAFDCSTDYEPAGTRWVAIDDQPWLWAPGCPNLLLIDVAVGLTINDAVDLLGRLRGK